MTNAADRLERLRDLLHQQRFYLAEHGFLYDAPGIEPNDIEWVIAEIERLRAERDEARRVVLELWDRLPRPIDATYDDVIQIYSWVPDTRKDPG